MRCANCGEFSLAFLCGSCKRVLAESRLFVREIDGFKIYYFYDFSEIKNLIHSKHYMHGRFVLNSLCKLSFKNFSKIFKPNFALNAVAIDDRNFGGYSHTAILSRALKSEFIKPIFGALHATSNVKYSGEDLKFRQSNPRNFKITKEPKFPVILVDDVVTTGTTMLEARDTFIKAGFEVAFGIVLADARS
ncbi:ComF family protein [Campylobacter mucosalis]|uniref:ComF family protein n=1 Tax=Campylobacter mucosalis TaxID=202 RepID=UPI00146FFB22|nr:ComF family protein [Campylobacter mucosalis]